MKKIKVAINGFGRIGRAYLRLAHACDDVVVVAVNDLMSVETAAYLLKYDSVHGTFSAPVSAEDAVLVVGGTRIPFLSVKTPTELPWRTMDVDVVLEATGVFASYEKAYMHVVAGARHVIISAPVKDAPPENVKGDTVLMGVNTDRAAACTVTSNASCTTNAVGIPLSVLDRAIGVESAILTTVHSYTATQQLVDAPTKKRDLRNSRSAALNIIPASTGAAIATTKVLTGLKNRFDGIALRVPTASDQLLTLPLLRSVVPVFAR